MNDEIQSTVLTPTINISGSIGAGSFIINDYLLTITEGEGEYTLSIVKGSQTQTAIIKDAISILSIEQIVASQEDYGLNTIRITLSNGEYFDFDFYNGSKGDKGDPGLTQEEKQEIIDAESSRVTAENARVLAEQNRVSAENERVLVENIRRGEEAERIVKEKGRVSAESSRVNAENARDGAEAIRRYNENQRNSSELERQGEWNELKTDVNNAIGNIINLQDDVQELAGQVEGAASDVLEACINVNNEITRAETVLQEVEEASGDIIGMTAVATTLAPGSQATVSYTDGILAIGVPKGSTGDAFHIVKTYSSVYEMNADYYNQDVQIGDFVIITSTVEDPDNAKVYVKGSSAYTFVVDMSGAAGIQGPPGADGVSPSVATSAIEHGHTIIVFDSTGAHQFNVYDGNSVTNVEFRINDDGNLEYQVSIY